jgi:hypothetical protein
MKFDDERRIARHATSRNVAGLSDSRNTKPQFLAVDSSSLQKLDHQPLQVRI